MKRTHRIGILVFPGVTLLDVAGPTEAFNEANREGVKYEMVLISRDGRPVESSTGLRFFVDGTPEDYERFDTLVVPGSDALATSPIDTDLIESVWNLANRSQRVTSVCTGAFLLAAAGLLDGRRATTHWRHVNRLARQYPTITVEPDARFVANRSVVTSAGVTAGIDLALALIESDYGPSVARDVARSLVVFLQRLGGQSQFSVPARAPRPDNELLRQVLNTVSANPAGDYSVSALAEATGTSTQHLTRLFRSALGTTPARHVELVRLEYAQILLNAGNSVSMTALESGFGSDENLRRAFHHHLGISPSIYRQRFASVTPLPISK